MNYDHIFDSSAHNYEVKYEIHRTKKEEITVFFEKESIVLTADAHGNATFESVDGTLIRKDKAESKIFFKEIHCIVREGAVNVRFPIIETVDHYPNCDGEYDRYSERIVDNILITCPVG